MHTSPANIPGELKIRNQWVGFKVTATKKRPVIADAPHKSASSTNPTTWRSFDAAAKGLNSHAFNGIGFCLNGDFVGVDLDDVVVDGKLTPGAQDIVTALNSYTEFSISGRGVHILLTGSLSGMGKRFTRDSVSVEIYHRGRFFVCTGEHVTGTPADIRSNPDAVRELVGPQQGARQNNICDSVTLRLCDSVTPTPETEDLLCDSVTVATMTPTEAITATLPTAPGQRNASLFKLARALRFNCGLAGSKLSQIKPHVESWFRKALPTIGTKDFTTSWSDFTSAWKDAQFPLGDVVGDALRRAQVVPMPPEAEAYDRPEARLLCSLCFQLSRGSADKVFFLSAHTAGGAIHVKPMQAHRWLRMFEGDEVLALVALGDYSKHRASRFRWIATDETSTKTPTQQQERE